MSDHILKWTPFTPDDWDSFAGCECFPTEEQPIMGCVGNVLYVCDKNGYQVYTYTDNEGDDGWAEWDYEEGDPVDHPFSSQQEAIDFIEAEYYHTET